MRKFPKHLCFSVEAEQRWSVTRLRTYQQCPRHYFLRYLAHCCAGEDERSHRFLLHLDRFERARERHGFYFEKIMFVTRGVIQSDCAYTAEEIAERIRQALLRSHIINAFDIQRVMTYLAAISYFDMVAFWHARNEESVFACPIDSFMLGEREVMLAAPLMRLESGVLMATRLAGAEHAEHDLMDTIHALYAYEYVMPRAQEVRVRRLHVTTHAPCVWHERCYAADELAALGEQVRETYIEPMLLPPEMVITGDDFPANAHPAQCLYCPYHRHICFEKGGVSTVKMHERERKVEDFQKIT